MNSHLLTLTQRPGGWVAADPMATTLRRPQSAVFTASTERSRALVANRRRRNLWFSLPILAALALAGVGFWLWRVVGADLGAGTHINAKHEELAASQGVARAGSTAVTPGGPVAANLPRRHVETPVRDRVAQAILSGARDQLARKVAAVSQSVDDPHAAKGNSFDLIDRGLTDILPLRTAVLRHRARVPHLYGLASKVGAEERSRAFTGDSLAVFLMDYGSRVGNEEALEPGDILMVQRHRLGARPMPAVVSDSTDEMGNALVITLDPADHVAREQPVTAYQVRDRFRLRDADLIHIRTALDLSDLRLQGPTRTL